MKYLKEFSTESDYLAYRDDKSNYLKPNVSLCEGNSTVYYNYPPKPKANGYEYVDLGLPSGTLWASCNIGASKPSDYGLYFHWGDTQGYSKEEIEAGKKKFASVWSDYKWYLSGSTFDNSIKFKKYTTPGAILELEDDAAHVNMGGDWHMPTPEQIRELTNTANTTRTWTTQGSVWGELFTSRTDESKFIFIPAAGMAWDGSVGDFESYGGIWSSMLSTSDITIGQYLYFLPVSVGLSSYNRSYGYSVRGVIDINI